MGRPLRIQYPGALYYITARGNEKRDIFLNVEDRLRFLERVADYHDRYSVLVHCYVLMNNHYHLLLETPLGNLVKVMHGINSCYTGYFNHKYSRSGHLFQGRYRAILVDKENYLLELTRFVHLNSVRAGIVDNPEKYRWSSFPGYVHHEKRKSWVEYSWVLSRFGSDAVTAGRQYREFVQRKTSGNQQGPLRGVYGQSVLGSEGFVEERKGKITDEKINLDVVEQKRMRQCPHPEKIFALVAEAFGVLEAVILEKKGRNNTARKVAIYLIKRYSGLSNKEIGKLFRGIHYSAVSKVSSRLEVELSDNIPLAEMIDRIVSNVKT
jgi:putative transposase